MTLEELTRHLYDLQGGVVSLDACRSQAERWLRTEPQTPEEVQQGVLAERERRLGSADRGWAGKLTRKKSKGDD